MTDSATDRNEVIDGTLSRYPKLLEMLNLPLAPGDILPVESKVIDKLLDGIDPADARTLISCAAMEMSALMLKWT